MNTRMKEIERKINENVCVCMKIKKKKSAMFKLGDCLSIVYTKAYVR